MELTKNQQEVFNKVEGGAENFFITGKPGVGKSVLINHLVEHGRKSYTLAAPTGLAALNISGRTLNSIFRIPIFDSIIELDYNKFPTDGSVINMIRYNINHLIIDEISMVRCDTLDYIDRLMKFAKNNDKAFGGCQVIVVGDFFQLPPVSTGLHTSQLKEQGYSSTFAFSSKAWVDAKFKYIEMDEVLRQKDPKFINILHKARTGDITIPQCGLLNSSVGTIDDLRILLCGTNQQADRINSQHLKSIQESEVKFIAKDYGTWPVFPVEKELRLKVGAQVMVKMNGADRDQNEVRETYESSEGFTAKKAFVSQVVNGTLAKVLDFEKGGVILIELEDGNHVRIYTQTWQRKVKQKVDGEWEETIVASYEQVPLSLAWAISIHKSQGQSFDKVHIDPSRIFAAGQLYVALSRARNLEGLKFSSPVSTRKFFADEKVKKFYKQLK